MLQPIGAIILATALAAPVQTGQVVEPVLVVGEMWRQAGEVRVDLDAEGLFGDQARRDLEQGGVSMLVYQLEVYRKRSGWFDSLVETSELVYRVSYDSFERRYRMQGDDIGVKSESFQEVVGLCTRLKGIQVCSLERLDREAEYYLVIRCAFQPMSLESLDELRTWVEGGEPPREREERRQGVGSRLARMLMSAAGFGEKQLQGTGPTFRPNDLPER